MAENITEKVVFNVVYGNGTAKERPDGKAVSVK